MRTKIFVVWIVAIAVCGVAASMAFGANLWEGTWKVNLTKSTFIPGPAPKNPEIAQITATVNGLRWVGEYDNDKGQREKYDVNAKFDGKDYPFKQTINGKADTSIDTISAKRIDEYTVEYTDKSKGKIIVVGKDILSTDGRTITETETGTSEGHAFKNTSVFERQ